MSVSGRFEDLVPLRPWEMTWNGRTWRDMPGGEEVNLIKGIWQHICPHIVTQFTRGHRCEPK